VTANPTLLQMKYARIIRKLAEARGVSLDEALDLFYRSETYRLIAEGVSDLHCMSDEYLVQELEEEYGGPVHITKNGTCDPAVMSIEKDEQLAGENDLHSLPEKGPDDLRNGRVSPASDGIEGIRAELRDGR